MSTDDNRDDTEKGSTESSLLKQEKRTDNKLLGEFRLAALAGLSPFFPRY
jgi:hypothetical protein